MEISAVVGDGNLMTNRIQKLRSLRAELQEHRALFPILRANIEAGSSCQDRDDHLIEAFDRACGEYVRGNRAARATTKWFFTVGIALVFVTHVVIFLIAGSFVYLAFLLGVAFSSFIAGLMADALRFWFVGTFVYAGALIAQTAAGYALVQREGITLLELAYNMPLSYDYGEAFIGISLLIGAPATFIASSVVRLYVKLELGFIKDRWRKDFAQSGVALTLTLVLRDLAKGRPYGDESQSETLEYLDVAADLLRSAPPRNIGGLRARENRAILEHLSASARVVDSYRLSVLLPKHDTFSLLRGQIAEIVATVLLGNYGSLPKESIVPSPQASWIRRSLRLIRLAVVAALPIAVVFAADAIGFQLPESVSDTLIFASILWAVIVVVTIVDPQLERRMNMTRDALAILRGSSS